jgi:hypothetical protein
VSQFSLYYEICSLLLIVLAVTVQCVALKLSLMFLFLQQARCHLVQVEPETGCCKSYSVRYLGDTPLQK